MQWSMKSGLHCILDGNGTQKLLEQAGCSWGSGVTRNDFRFCQQDILHKTHTSFQVGLTRNDTADAASGQQHDERHKRQPQRGHII